MKRTVSVVLAIIFVLIPAAVIGIGLPWGYLPAYAVFDGGLLEHANAHVAANFPARDTLAGWSLAVRVLGGQREHDQIFIVEDELIPALDPPLDDIVEDNTRAILEFARFVEQWQMPVYCMIIPTVSAIRQPNLPNFLLGQNVNQEQFIYDVYAQMLGRVRTIDAYNALSDVRDQYIFYRTENNLTALGGFYLYYALGGSLLEGVTRPSLQNYDIEHVKFDFLGDLYERSPFPNVRADILSIFRYRRAVPPREYTVVTGGNGVFKTYHTLFPLHVLDLAGNRAMEIYLGGLNAKTVITTSSPYPNNLLVIGDRTALAYVPFLANHYRTVTLLDLSQMSGEDFEIIADAIRRNFYDQALFAFSIETYMHSPYPAWAIYLLPDLEDY